MTEGDRPGDTAAPTDSRLGAAIELPWWVIPLGLPPLITLALGVILGAPLSGRLLDVGTSAALLWALGRISTRVRSSSMQSVWISAVYPFWLIVVLLWAVEVHG